LQKQYPPHLPSPLNTGGEGRRSVSTGKFVKSKRLKRIAKISLGRNGQIDYDGAVMEDDGE
jgi:hypothetical protein